MFHTTEKVTTLSEMIIAHSRLPDEQANKQKTFPHEISIQISLATTRIKIYLNFLRCCDGYVVKKALHA
jgi:hypothetical protein